MIRREKERAEEGMYVEYAYRKVNEREGWEVYDAE